MTKIHVKHVTQIPVTYIEEDNVFVFTWLYGLVQGEWKNKWHASLF